MPARDANRGRGGGGRGRAANRSKSAGGRQANAGASPSSSARGGSTRSAGARGESEGGRAGSRTTGTARTSRTAGGPGEGIGRAIGGSEGAVRRGGGTGSGASSGVSGAARRSAGVSTGIAAGDVASGGIATPGAASQSASRAPDVDASLFGGGLTTEASQTSERQRDLESVREISDTGLATPPTSRSAQARAQPGARAAARPQAARGLSAWLAGADNPLAMMRRMQEDLDSVFRAFGVPRLGAALVPPRELEELLVRTPALSQTAQWSPQIEVFEREGDIVVHADLPGVKRDDVEVSVDDDVLTIRGERRHENRETQGGYRRTERSYGTFFRQIPLPDGVDPTEIAAAYEDGVLEVIIPSPRDQQRARRRVDIR
jgi:HSP20 family protein